MWSLIPWKKSDGGALTSEPFEQELSRIRSDFDLLFNRVFRGLPAMGNEFFDSRPSWGLDVDETETHYVARVPAPGYEVEDFDVHVAGNHLVVKAEHQETQEGRNGGSGYRYGRVQRMIPLPDGAETDKIDANYHSGILELRIPKGKQSQAKRITVKSG